MHIKLEVSSSKDKMPFYSSSQSMYRLAERVSQTHQEGQIMNFTDLIYQPTTINYGPFDF